MTFRVLIADGDPVVREGLLGVLANAGHAVRSVSDALGLRRGLAEDGAELVLASVELADAALASGTATVVLAGAGEVERAFAALGRGACDVLEKPCSRERALATVERAERVLRVERERARLANELERVAGAALIGRSPALRRVLEQVERVARTPRTTVLLRGETGVEKERVARAIHIRSARASAPFVVCRVAAADPAALEETLFGARAGQLAAAEGGTLYLDDVDHLPLAVQARLLRLLQDRTYRQNGAGEELRADVRLIAATGGKLEEQVGRGAFREDLFYRLNVLSLPVPALRERGDDVLELAHDALRRKAEACGRPVRAFTAAALAALAAHRWPGNLLELENVVERAVLFARAEIVDVSDLALRTASDSAPAGEFLPLGDRSLRALEEALIRRVLAEVGGNKSRAAELLGINRATLYNKLQALSLGA
ncbi:MAG: sigma-54-dependent Fis family transcriptional regulator [Planctomycetes bacterium]|nr:sigma-54-dependent Fis family transcriptional regulator [Planctomycetota bacterium]